MGFCWCFNAWNNFNEMSMAFCWHFNSSNKWIEMLMAFCWCFSASNNKIEMSMTFCWYFIASSNWIEMSTALWWYFEADIFEHFFWFEVFTILLQWCKTFLRLHYHLSFSVLLLGATKLLLVILLELCHLNHQRVRLVWSDQSANAIYLEVEVLLPSVDLLLDYVRRNAILSSYIAFFS